MKHDKPFWDLLDKLIQENNIVIDRPKGTKHPRHGFVYEVDYGFLHNTSAMDHEGIDVFLGSAGNEADAVVVTIDLVKKDAEIKLLIGCTEEEKTKICHLLNSSEYMKALMIHRGAGS